LEWALFSEKPRTEFIASPYFAQSRPLLLRKTTTTPMAGKGTHGTEAIQGTEATQGTDEDRSKVTVSKLLESCAYVPRRMKMSNPKVSTDVDQNLSSLIERLEIEPKDLNALTLRRFGKVEIDWTTNICRHLRLSRQGNRHILEVFAYPPQTRMDPPLNRPAVKHQF
jgi:hypothetical protein